jgi:hypothetical protein
MVGYRKGIIRIYSLIKNGMPSVIVQITDVSNAGQVEEDARLILPTRTESKSPLPWRWQGIIIEPIKFFIFIFTILLVPKQCHKGNLNLRL